MWTNPGVFGIVARGGVEEREAFGGFGGFAQGHLQDFGQVQGVTVGFLGDLFAATEAVGNDEPVGRRLPDGGKKFQFADGARDFVLLFLKTKSASHAAASGRGRGEVDAHAAEDGFLGSHLHDGFVMAVAVNQRFAGELRDREIFGVLLKEFAEQEDLFRERVGTFVVGEEVDQLVAEDGGATGL